MKFKKFFPILAFVFSIISTFIFILLIVSLSISTRYLYPMLEELFDVKNGIRLFNELLGYFVVIVFVSLLLSVVFGFLGKYSPDKRLAIWALRIAIPQLILVVIGAYLATGIVM